MAEAPVKLSEEEEFEFRRRAEMERGASGSVTSELLKGIPRGVMQTGLAAARGGLTTVLGPGAELAMQGLEKVAEPITAPFAASPTTPAEKWAGVGGEFMGGMVAPGVPGMAGRTVNLAKRAVSPITKPLRSLVDPLLPGGTDRAVGRILLKLAGEKRAPVMRSLAEATEHVPGSAPTAAEAAAKAGSAEFSGAQRVAVANRPTPYSDIAAKQEAARRAAIESFGRTPKALENTITMRANQAADLYGKASRQILRVDDDLKQLMTSDSMKSAMKRVESIETEFGKAMPSPEGTMSVGKLHYLKMAMDDLVSTPERFGIGAAEVKAIMGTREQFINWLVQRSPDYDRARKAYAGVSKLIDEMRTGQTLQSELTAPLGAHERAAMFARSMRDQPKTLKKATGQTRYEKLEEVVGPENAAKAQGVLDDLNRQAQQRALAKTGAEKASEIIGTEVPSLPATGPLHQKYMIFKTAFNRFGGKLGEKELARLSEVLETPKETLKLMEAAAKREAFIERVASEIPQTLSEVPFLPQVGGAAAVLEGQ